MERLDKIYVTVNDWLKYAETKNAILFPVLVAIFLGVLSILFQNKIEIIWIKIYLYNVLVFTFIGAVSIMLSFFPNIKKPFIFSGEKSNNSNLLYFGDIQQYSTTDFKKVYCDKYCISTDTITSMDEDYIQQIIINSKITFKKLIFFKIGLFLMLSAFITIFLSLFVFVLLEN